MTKNTNSEKVKQLELQRAAASMPGPEQVEQIIKNLVSGSGSNSDKGKHSNRANN